MKRFQWRVLPQGMSNSPTLCQSFVDATLQEIRSKWQQMYLVHYMDDILLAGEKEDEVLQCYSHLSIALHEAGLQIAPEKVQLQDPYTYLGFQMKGAFITSPKPLLHLDHLTTLNDFQKLLGDINWLVPYLKISKSDLKPLYDILKGDSQPTSPRYLTPNSREAINIVQRAISNQTITFIDYSKPLIYIIFKAKLTPTAVFWQDCPTPLGPPLCLPQKSHNALL